MRWAICVAVMGAVGAAGELTTQRCPRPAEFANVFSFGYAADPMPKEPARFDELLGKLKAGGFNTVSALFVANHNCYAGQAVALKLAKPLRVHLFDRKKGEWRSLKVTDGSVTFPLDPAGGELLRLDP